MNPSFEYDPQKNRRNQELHGADLSEAQALWDLEHVIIPAHTVGQEIRHTILGIIDGRLRMAVFTQRANIIRLITYHKADRRLQRIYEKKISEKKDG